MKLEIKINKDLAEYLEMRFGSIREAIFALLVEGMIEYGIGLDRLKGQIDIIEVKNK